MGVFRGSEVSLDGLLGYNKLQELLSLIIEHLNEQDSSLSVLREDSEKQRVICDQVRGSVQVLHDQSAGVEEQLRKQVEEVVSSGGGCSESKEAIEALETRLSGLEAKVFSLEAASTALRTELTTELTTELRTEFDTKLDTKMRELRSGILADCRADREIEGAAASKALSEAISGLREELREELPTKWAEDIDAASNSLREALDAARDELAERLGKAEEALVGATDSMRKVEEAMSDIEKASMKSRRDLSAATEEVRGHCIKLSEVTGDMRSRIAALEHFRNVGGHGAGGAHGEQLGAVCESMNSVERELSELQSRMQQLTDKEGFDVLTLSHLISELKKQLAQVLGRSSAATSRCLSCFDSRKQAEERIIIGTDGKPYLRSRHPAVMNMPGSNEDQLATWGVAALPGGNRGGGAISPVAPPLAIASQQPHVRPSTAPMCDGSRGRVRRNHSNTSSAPHLHGPGGAGAPIRRHRETKSTYDGTFLPPPGGANNAAAAVGAAGVVVDSGGYAA